MAGFVFELRGAQIARITSHSNSNVAVEELG